MRASENGNPKRPRAAARPGKTVGFVLAAIATVVRGRQPEVSLLCGTIIVLVPDCLIAPARSDTSPHLRLA